MRWVRLYAYQGLHRDHKNAWLKEKPLMSKRRDTNTNSAVIRSMDLIKWANKTEKRGIPPKIYRKISLP